MKQINNSLFVIALVSLLIFSSCNRSRSDCVSFNEDGIPVIAIEDITEEGELSFTDIAEEFDIVKLETREECLIDVVFRKYATKDFIIISTSQNGIYVFRRDGSFIKKIADFGRGPREIYASSHSLEYDEIKNRLYVTNDIQSSGSVYCYDLPSGDFSKYPLQTGYRVRDIICKDTIQLFATLSFDSDLKAICQTETGNLLYKINHTNENKSYEASIINIDNEIFYSYNHGGGKLYTLKNEKLAVHSEFSIKGNFYTAAQQDIGDVLLFLHPINKNMIRGIFSRVTGLEVFNSRGNKRATFSEFYNFVYNNKKKSAYLIEKIDDDILGSEKTMAYRQSNGLFAQEFEAHEIFALMETQKDDQDISEEIKTRVKRLAEEIDINDNPVILVGKMK